MKEHHRNTGTVTLYTTLLGYHLKTMLVMHAAIYPERAAWSKGILPSFLCSCVFVCVHVCVYVCVHRYYDRDLLKNNNRQCPLVLKTEGKLETSTIDFFLVPVATDFNYSRAPDELSRAEPSWLWSFCKNNMNETDLSTCIHSHVLEVVVTLV